MSEYSTKGTLCVADIWLEKMPDWQTLNGHCETALKKSNMNVLNGLVHQFEPQGTTAVWILAESHMALHTYPEQNFLAVDVFTCGDEGDPAAAVKALIELLPTTASNQYNQLRGKRPIN
tara:strand:- start:1113 stop:1469 length:357 start_codon:yes stop_codon:yes gene_type:complete